MPSSALSRRGKCCVGKNINTMKRQAYGYRDQEFIKLRMMGIHEAKYALTG